MKTIKLLAVLTLLVYPYLLSAQVYDVLATGEKIKGEPAYILPKATLVFDIPITTIEITKGKNFLKKISGVTLNDAQIETLEKKYGVDPKKYKSMLGLTDGKVDPPSHKVSEDSIKLNIAASPDYTKVIFVKSKSKWNKAQSVKFTYGSDGMITEGEANTEDKTFDLVVKAVSGVVSIVGSFFKSSDGNLKPADSTNDIEIKELDNVLLKYKQLEGQLNFEIYKDLKSTYDKEYAKIFSNLFYSEKKKTTVKKVFYTPGSDTSLTNEIPLFELDSKSGTLTFNKDLENEIWGKDLIFKQSLSSAYSISFLKIKEQQVDFFTARSNGNVGFAFNIPLKTEIRLFKAKNTSIIDNIYKIPQFGSLGYIDTRKEKIAFSLDSLSGELKKISIEGKSVTTDQVASTSTGSTEIIKLIKGDSTDTKLENEVKRLENEKKKRDLLKALEIE